MSVHQSEYFSFAGFVAEALQTREIRKAIDSVITEIINQWEKGNTVKSIISNPAKWFVNKSFSKPEDSQQKNELLPLIKRLDLIEHIGVIAPVFMNGLSEIINTIAVSLENASLDKQKQFFEHLASSVNPERLAQTITAFEKATDAIHRNNPTFFSEKAIPGIRSFIENTDFSDLKKLVGHSKEDINSMVKGLNDLLVEFPGKLITGLSFIPEVSNHILIYFKDLIYRFTLLPADILTDILISLLKELDDKTIGACINNVNALIRQVHTGSALIGEPGAPKFSSDLLEKLTTIQREINNELLLKSGNALIDGKEVIQKTFNALLNNDQEFLKVHLHHLILSYNSKITVLKEKIEIIDELNEDDSESLASIISEINVSDLAEIINTFFIILNTLQDHSPQMIQKIIFEFTNTLDLNEIESSLKTIMLDNSTSIGPLVRTMFPIIVDSLIDCLSAENDDNDEKIDNARKKVCQFIMGKEV